MFFQRSLMFLSVNNQHGAYKRPILQKARRTVIVWIWWTQFWLVFTIIVIFFIIIIWTVVCCKDACDSLLCKWIVEICYYRQIVMINQRVTFASKPKDTNKWTKINKHINKDNKSSDYHMMYRLINI